MTWRMCCWFFCDRSNIEFAVLGGQESEILNANPVNIKLRKLVIMYGWMYVWILLNGFG